MFKLKMHHLFCVLLAVLIIGVMGCEELIQDALEDVSVDVDEPLFNGTYTEPVTKVNVTSDLLVSNGSAKAMKVSGVGSDDFSVEDTRKLLFSLDFGSVIIEGDIVNSSSTVESISFYFSTNPSLTDPAAGGDLIFSKDLAPGINTLIESLNDGSDGLNQPDATVVASLKAFVSDNQGQPANYTVYAVIPDGADDVTVSSFDLNIGAVYIQKETFTSDSLEKYSSENTQLEDGYIEGSVTVNGSAATTFKIYLGDTGGLYPDPSQIVAGKDNIGSGSTFTMSKANKGEYLVNETLLNEKLTALSEGESVEANLYIYSSADVNVTLNSSIRGTLTLAD